MALIDDIIKSVWKERDNPPGPQITLSYAQSLDGSIAIHRGEPLSLSSLPSKQLTHQLRGVHGAILVGIGTVLADNPRLTVRLTRGKHPQPVILDTRLRMPLDAHLLQHPSPPWIFTGPKPDAAKVDALETMGVRIWRAPIQREGRLHLPSILERLDRLGIESVMVEGGACIITSFLRERLVDGLVVTIAPTYVGGLNSIERLAIYSDQSLENISTVHFPRLKEIHSTRLGPDLIVWGRLEYPAISYRIDERSEEKQGY